jgi:hypothetical protein
MEGESIATLRRRSVAFAAAIALSASALFGGVPVSVADPYGDDDGGSSYGGGDEGGGAQEPAGGGVQEPPGGGMDEAPGGGDHSGDAHEPSGGGDESGSPQEPAGGGGEGGDTQDPSGGATQEPSGGGTHDAPGDGGMAEPTELEASPQDVATANASRTEEVSSEVASSEEITTYRESIESTFTSSTLSTAMTLSSPVSLWNSSWISYDPYYRPLFINPYQSPLQVVYDYGGKPQVFTVQPLQRAAIDVPNSGVYNFTAMTRPASGPVSNVSVGSFSGGGYVPPAGQAPPQKPAALKTIKNALVQVKFTRGTSDPFRVGSLADLGKDPAVNGATKVLLDSEIPAWGDWSKNEKGEALFVITETALLPGINPPGQDPLPGYKVQLSASQQSESWFERNQTVLIGVAVGAGVLALAIVLFLLTRRRSSAQ